MKIKDLEEIKKYCLGENVENHEVSNASVYWHLDHAFQVITNISKVLIKSNPEEFKGKFKPNWAIIKTTGRIPRGAGRAPKAVVPTSVATTESLLAQYETVKSLLNRVYTLDPKAHFKHPVFGILDLKNTLRFLSIHTNHHLKIIRDILK